MKGRYVTSEDKEEFRKVTESEKRIIYVSSQFRVIYKDKKTRNEFELKQKTQSNRNYKYVRINGKQQQVNRLVYENFIRSIPKGKKIECVGERKIENLRLVPGNEFINRKKKVAVKVGDHVYESILDCANAYNYSLSHVNNMLKGKRTNVIGVEYARL